MYFPWSEINLNGDNIYRTLDKPLAKKDDIVIDIFHVLNPDTSMVHYDLTSSYFEGKEENDLVLFGNSREKKKGKRADRQRTHLGRWHSDTPRGLSRQYR